MLNTLIMMMMIVMMVMIAMENNENPLCCNKGFRADLLGDENDDDEDDVNKTRTKFSWRYTRDQTDPLQAAAKTPLQLSSPGTG